MMAAARTSETLVNFYQTTRSYNPEASHLQVNMKSCVSLNKYPYKKNNAQGEVNNEGTLCGTGIDDSYSFLSMLEHVY
jgi:hypothetical protein